MKTESRSKSAPLRILYVDKGTHRGVLAGQALESRGHHVDVVQDVNEGITCIENSSYDVIMVDFPVPGWDGLDAIRDVNRIFRPVPVLLALHDNGASPVCQVFDTSECNDIHKDSNEYYCDLLCSAIGQLMQRQRLANRIKYIEEELKTANAIFETTASAVIVTDSRYVIEAVNPAFTVITGYSCGEALGRTPAMLSSGRHNEQFYNSMWKSLAEDARWEGEIWNRRKNGEIYPQWLTITAIRDESGEPARYVGVFSDISRGNRYSEQIWRQANYDALTGLPNRSLFLDRLAGALYLARRDNNMVALLFIDLDHFKRVNDARGHLAGDELLQEAVRRLTDCIRLTDTVARMGGDEFTAVLTGITQIDDVKRVVEKILKNLSEKFVVEGKYEVFVSASIGITIFPTDGIECETLLRNADTAMYQAKASGRNTYRFFTASMNEAIAKRTRLEQELRRALDRSEFVLYYQPVLEPISERIVGIEALLRWNHPARGVVCPSEFIDLAEETGLILPLGEWVMATALSQAASWGKNGFNGIRYLSVNCSSSQFREKTCEAKFSRALREASIPAWMFGIEVCEDLFLDERYDAAPVLSGMSRLGVTLLLDDFGTGFTSLSHLRRFPVDIVKIDKLFIQGVTNDADAASLTRAIIAMAHTLDVQVVAEGVETHDQLDFLCRAGCDMVQGYYFTRPLSSGDFELFLEQRLSHSTG